MTRLPPLMLMLLLAGCAASQCDPNAAGFFAGIGCAVGGGYAARRDALTTEDYQSRVAAANAANEAGAARTAEQIAQQNLGHERAQLARMERQQHDLARRLATARANHSATQAQLDKADRELAALRHATRAQATEAAPDPAAVARLKAKQQNLLGLMARM